jgi:hypothetical protein
VATISSAVSLTMTADLPSKLTAVAPARFVPEIVTWAPTRAWRGESPVIVGAPAGASKARITISVVVEPTATQVAGPAQETLSTFSTPAGSVVLFQIVPPSVVDIASPVSVNPLVVSSTLSPTAVQSEVLEQEMSLTSLTPAGKVWVLHVVPSVVAARVGTAEPTVLTADAQQSDVPAHPTVSRKANPLGGVWVAQVAPPSVVAIRASTPSPKPPAQQSDVVGHEMSSRSWTVSGMVSEDQIEPASVVATTPPTLLALTAKQSDVVGHEMP